MQHKDKVKCWIDSVVLQTLEVGSDNPHPFFDGIEDFNPRCHPYPHAAMFKDRISSNKKYKAIHLENKYLHVITLPEVGGRIWSCLDKRTNKDIFHKANRVSVTYQPGGTSRGTYVGLGVEISYPDHHSQTNAIPREYSILENSDNSKTIALGELSLRGRLRWSVHLTLRPDEAVLYYKFLVHNRSNLFVRGKYWGNASMLCGSKNFECIYPEKFGWEHGGEYGVSTWPIYDGVDMRFPTRNVPWPIGLESKDVRDGFYAYYNHDEKYGMVHWANPGEAPGKKYWTWGYCHCGIRHAHYYADGRLYMEMQSGRCEDQEDFEVIKPFSTVTWTELWYPVGDIGGISSAADTVALNCKPKVEKDKVVGINLSLQSTKYQKIKITITSKNKMLAESNVNLEPTSSKNMDLSFNQKLSLKETFKTEIFDKQRLILSYEYKDEKFYDSCVDRIILSPPEPKEPTSDQLVADVEKMMRYFPRAFKEYEPSLKEAIRKDSGHSYANKYLGILFYRAGLIKEAKECFNKVFERREYDGEAHFYLGLCYLKEKNEVEARWQFWQAVRYYKQELGYYYLGVLDFKDSILESSIEMFRKTLDHNANHINARVYLALCLAKTGKKEEARRELLEAENRYPLEPFIIIGKILVEEGTLKNIASLSITKRLNEQLHKDIQTYYELILDLSLVGLYKEAMYLLKEARIVCKKSEGIGFIDYYEGWLNDKLGFKAKAKASFLKGKKEDIKYTFPFRLEEEEIIETALRYNEKDGTAYYYLGMIRGAQERFNELYEIWKKTLKLGIKNSIIYRGLGKISIKIMKDEERAIKNYENGLKLNPDDVQVRNDLIDIYQKRKNKKELERLFKHSTMFTNIELISKFVNFNLSIGNYDIAVEVICNKANFPNQAQQLQPIHENALVSRALYYISKNKFKEAIKDLEKALETPCNLGNFPRLKIKQVQSKVQYFLGLAYRKTGNEKKAEEIWEQALKEQEGPLWEGSGSGYYDVSIDRYYQGRMLLELGRKEEAQVYFDILRATALSKYKSRLGPVGQKELFELAYEGRSEKEITKVEADSGYLFKE